LAAFLPLALFAQCGLLLPALALAQGQLCFGVGLLCLLLSGIQVVVAAVAAQPAGSELDNALHLAQQCAVMADDDQPAAPLRQRIDQPLAMRAVEVVAGLVQHQGIRVGEQGAGQRHLHGLAAAERGGRLRGIQLGQAEPLPLRLQLLAQGPAFAHQGEVARVHAAGFDPVQRIQYRGDAGQVDDAAGQHATVQGQQVYLALPLDVPTAGLQLPGQQAAEHALAHTIATDQAGGSGIERSRKLREEHPAIGQGECHAVEREGECGHATSSNAKDSPCEQGGKETGRPTTAALLAHAGTPHYGDGWMPRVHYTATR